MGSSIGNSVYYCCIWNNGKVLYAYNDGVDQEIDNLAALCLPKAPPHHKWYFQTISNKTFGFLMDDKFVYFAIVDRNVGNRKSLEFLGSVRDEFRKVSKKGSKMMNSVVLQDKLMPVVRRLIASLEVVVVEGAMLGNYSDGLSPSPTSNDNSGMNDIVGSTKTPLLGKASKQEKRKTRDHVISVRENGVVEEHRKSGDKGVSKVDSSSLDVNNQGGSVTGISLTKEVSSVTRSSNQTVRNKWCRQVRIVLAVDVVVCLILFIVWLVVCRGTQCLR